MILSYGDARTERFARGQRVKQFEPFRHQAENRLVRLEVAASLRELAALRGNRLEKLSGDRKGQWSMRINDQWRICFDWPTERQARATWKSWIIVEVRHGAYTNPSR